MSLEVLNNIFSWNPPALRSAPRKSVTKKTRPPAFFDKHLSDTLLLQHVKHRPNLAKEIASLVDKTISAATADNAELPPPIGLPKDFQTFMKDSKRTMQNEQDVAGFYIHAATNLFLRAASMLALCPKADTSWWSLLDLRQASVLGYAIADGFLQWVPMADSMEGEYYRPVMDAMDPQMREFYENKSRSPVLATWEFKSLSVGRKSIMDEIPRLKSFSWTKCDAPDCDANPKHQTYKRKVEKLAGDDKQYIDAEKTPWDLNFPSPDPPPPTRKSCRILSKVVAKSFGATSSSTFLGSSSSSSSSRKKRKRQSEDADVFKKKQKHDDEDEEDENEEDKDESFKNTQELTAQDIIQQAWVQAVRENTTLFVIHSGNNELVCVRHRGTQTMYVSDLIVPAECGDPAYGKLHVGIYIAAIEDAKDRFFLWLRDAAQPSEDNQELPGSEEDQRRNDRGEGSSKRGNEGNGSGGNGGGNGSGSGSGNLSKDNQGKRDHSGSGPQGHKQVGNREMTVQEAAHRNTILMYLRYGIYDSPNPATFTRTIPSNSPVGQRFSTRSSPGKFNTIRPDDCLNVLLTSEIGSGATGVVLGGVLDLEESDSCTSLDIAVKLAITQAQREALSKEHGFYEILREKGAAGIVTTLGLFDDREGEASALVMLYAGESLATRAKPVSISEREAFIAALTSIHRAGIAHGDIRSDNLLIDSSGGVSIIDFDQAFETDSKKLKRREVNRLCRLLDDKGDN